MTFTKSRIFLVALVAALLISSAYTKQESVQVDSTAQQTQNAPDNKQANKVNGPQQKVKFLIFREDCLDKFLGGDIFNVECLKFTLSKGVSYGIIVGSLLYKAPQIIKILNSGSVEGLSLTSFYFQVLMVLISIGYNLHIKSPITTYAENISVLIQTVVIVVLYWKFNPKTSVACVVASTLSFLGLSAILLLDVLPNTLYEGIGILNIILFVLAVAPQIKENHQNRSTGQLAFVTVFLAWAGNIARVFTTTQEIQDPLILAFFIIGSILNGTVLLQFFIYGGGKTAVKGDKQRAKKE